MDEIRIYQSFTKRLLASAVALTLGAVSVLALCMIDAESGIMTGIFWAGVAFFGVGGLFLLTDALRNRSKGIAHIVIYRDRVEYYIAAKRAYHTINFADVERFRRVMSVETNFVAIDYKPDAAERISGEKSAIQQGLSKINKSLLGAEDAIVADDLSVKVGELTDLLNENLDKYRKNAK